MQNSTFLILYYECTNPRISWAFVLSLPNPGYGEAHRTEIQLSMDQLGMRPDLT